MALVGPSYTRCLLWQYPIGGNKGHGMWSGQPDKTRISRILLTRSHSLRCSFHYTIYCHYFKYNKEQSHNLLWLIHIDRVIYLYISIYIYTIYYSIVLSLIFYWTQYMCLYHKLKFIIRNYPNCHWRFTHPLPLLSLSNFLIFSHIYTNMHWTPPLPPNLPIYVILLSSSELKYIRWLTPPPVVVIRGGRVIRVVEGGNILAIT